MKKVLALIMALALVVCCFAACGEKPTPTTPTDATPTDATPTDETPAVEDLAAITAAGKIIVGITEYAPMDYLDANGEWTGFDAEFARLFGEKLGVEVEFIEVDWDNKVFELDDKKVDCIWNGMTITEQLMKSMDISNPYVKNSQVVVMKADKLADYTADNIADLTFAVEAGSAAESLANDNGYANITALAIQADALLEVESGKADAAIIDKTMAEAMTGEGTSYADLGFSIVLNDEVYGVGFRQGSDLVAEFNAFLESLVADGTLQTLAQKYGLALAD